FYDFCDFSRPKGLDGRAPRKHAGAMNQTFSSIESHAVTRLSAVRRSVVVLAGFLAVALIAIAAFTPVAAAKRDKYGYFVTGTAVRYKKIAFVNFKVYWVVHKMKEL